MKAITMEQPFASLVCIGAKTIETRPWSTAYRGPLAIHSATTVIPIKDSYYRSILFLAGLDCELLPLGKIIAIVRLAGCKKVITPEIPCYPQLALSNFTPGWYALELVDIKPLPKPVLADGGQGLWDWAY
jgi:activating signal cointegrator 1